jgi:hypothetical protein
MPLTRVQPGLLEATGTASSSTFLRGDGAWATTITSGTAVASTSGTSIDFTGIPSTAKRITVMFSGVSTNGSSNVQIQLGDSGGFETTGYVSTACSTYGAGSAISTSTAAFILTAEVAAAGLLYGNVVICLQNTSNNWVSSSVLSGNSRMQYASGGKSLSDTLTQVRITTVNGTDTFDAGTINIMWE